MSLILIVDDEEKICWALEQSLREEGYATVAASNARNALDLIGKTPPDLVLLDFKLPDMDGMEVLKKIRESNRTIPVILMTAHGKVQTAIQAMQYGAYDYLIKPLDLHGVRRVVKEALRSMNQDQGVTLPSPEALERFQIGNLVGKSPKMQEIYKLIGLLTMSDTTVLIKGESGAGKELVAKAIHFNSSRSSRPFVAINCTALQDTLLESELFGYEKGAFTGAASRTVGKFDLAHGGTLFFDEVGDMSPALQGKVLRVLQEKNFYRVGGRESISVDARIIAATHRDLEVEVREGRFREDLYYRLNVVSVNIPPLRERGEDIPYLVSHFLMRMRGELGRDITGVEDKVMDAFMKYPWPGNVRELENVLRRAAVLTRGSFISMEYLPEAFQGRSRLSDPFAELDQVIQKIFLQSASDESQGGSLFPSAIQQVERSLILAALEYSKWNQVKASKLLGINRGTLRKKMIEYNITPLGPEDEHSAPTDD